MKYANAYEIFALQMLKGEFYFTSNEARYFIIRKDYFILRNNISLNVI